MLEKLKKYKYIILILVFSLIYYSLTSVQNFNFIYFAGYDDYYMISSAMSILNFEWLGNFTGVTLTKGPGAPIFIAISNILGISLLKAQTILYIGACVLFVYVLKKVVKNDFARIIIFVFILFNPVLYEVELLRVYRDSINSSFLLYVVSCVFGIFLNYKENFKKIIPYMIGLGIFGTWMAITREEAFWISPFTIGSAVIICLFIIFDKECIDKTKKILLYLIPIGIYCFSIILICCLNKIAYGEFVRLENSSRPFKNFMSAITSVDVENPNILVPLSKEARYKLYDVSPSFKELKEYFEEGGGVEFTKSGKVEGEIDEGWLSWAIIAAVSEKGYDKDLKTLNDYYRKVTNEVNQAYSDGKLKKEDNPASIFEHKNWKDFLDNISKAYKFQVEMDNMNLILEEDKYFEDIMENTNEELYELVKDRQDLFREITGNISTNSKTYNYKIDKIKIKVLEIILRIYEIISKPLFVISFIIYILGILKLLMFKPRFKNYKEIIILTSLIMLHFIRILVIAYTETSMCPAINNVMYLSSTYSIQFAFEILGIIFGIKWIKNKLIRRDCYENEYEFL